MAVAAETRPGAGNGESQERQPVSATKLWVRNERTGNIILPKPLEGLVYEASLFFELQYRKGLIAQKVAVTIVDARGLKTDPESYLAQGPSGNSPSQLRLNIQFFTPSPALRGYGLIGQSIDLSRMISRWLPSFDEPSYVKSNLVVWNKAGIISPFGSPRQLVFSTNQFYFCGLTIHDISQLREDHQSALKLNPIEATDRKAIYVHITMEDVYRYLLDRAHGLKNESDLLGRQIKYFENRHNISPKPAKQPEPSAEQTSPEYDDYRRFEY